MEVIYRGLAYHSGGVEKLPFTLFLVCCVLQLVYSILHFTLYVITDLLLGYISEPNVSNEASLTINGRHIDCSSDSFLSLHHGVVKHIDYYSIPCCQVL